MPAQRTGRRPHPEHPKSPDLRVPGETLADQLRWAAAADAGCWQRLLAALRAAAGQLLTPEGGWRPSAASRRVPPTGCLPSGSWWQPTAAAAAAAAEPCAAAAEGRWVLEGFQTPRQRAAAAVLSHQRPRRSRDGRRQVVVAAAAGPRGAPRRAATKAGWRARSRPEPQLAPWPKPPAEGLWLKPPTLWQLLGQQAALEMAEGQGQGPPLAQRELPLILG